MDERGTIDGGRHAGGPDIATDDELELEDEAAGGADDDRQVGLGRVVVDRLSTGTPDPDDPGGPKAPPEMRDVTKESEQSFPASDPPSFTGSKAVDPPTSG
jgi:hypothetical protein